jgi:hypothetical protein
MATITAKELALLCDTDPKSMRRFIRSTDLILNCGQGNRYSIDTADATALIAAFKATSTPRAATPTRDIATLTALLASAFELEGSSLDTLDEG